jgi:anti-sigma regulatory factor (Ser/Thr protein kinase)
MSVSPAQEAVTVRVFVQRFSSTRRGARLARRLAVQRLDAWGLPYGTAVSDAVALVVAELGANAALHGCVPGRDFELRLSHNQETGVVRVEVSDTHPGQPKAPPEVTPEAPPTGHGVAEGGRGLLVVAAVAARWGVSGRVGPGKTVWAELECRGDGGRRDERPNAAP